MTIQWLLIASFLYLELGIIALLSLPFVSPKIWKCIFHFHLLIAIGRKANMYFTVFLMVLVLFFLDSIREMIKYSGEHKHEYDAELQMHMKLYRSQRNYFIVGFAIFLCFVIRRLFMLLLVEAELLSRNEEVTKSAQEATETLEKLLKENKESNISMSADKPNEQFLKEMERIQREISARNEELKILNENIKSIKDKNDGVSKEYDCLKTKVDVLKGSLTSSSE